MYNFQLRLLTKYINKMTEQRQKLLDEFNEWFDTNPNKRIMAAQCANIAEKYAAEQLKLYDVSQQREQLIAKIKLIDLGYIQKTGQQERLIDGILQAINCG